eukprot:ctg_2583.g518
MLLMGGPAPPPPSSMSGGGGGSFGSRMRRSHPTYLILAPTRELASQIFSECKKFCHATGIRAAVIYGGSENTREQLRAVENGVDVVVATPGRLLDFIDRGRISLANVQFLTLDEADRMLDMLHHRFHPAADRVLRGPSQARDVAGSAEQHPGPDAGVCGHQTRRGCVGGLAAASGIRGGVDSRRSHAARARGLAGVVSLGKDADSGGHGCGCARSG